MAHLEIQSIYYNSFISSSCPTSLVDWPSITFDMATPYKLRAINADKNQSSLRPLLRADLDAQIYTGIDIQEFVQKVWSIADEECEQVLSKDWKIDPLLEAKYNRLITTKSSEPYYYVVFQQIAHDLLKRFLPSLGLTGDMMFWESFGKTYVGSLKPDMLILWLRMQEPTWCNTKVPVEFKNVAVPNIPKFTLQTPHMPASLPEGHVAKNSDTQNAISSMDAIYEHKRHRILPITPMVTVDETEEFDGQQPAKAPTQQSIGSDIVVDTQPSASSAVPASGSKRKRDRKDEGRQPRRRVKKSSLTIDETQLASYALECFVANNRFYVPAVFIDKWFMTLWYFDRMGAVLSTTFDFRQQPKLLGLVLYALNKSGPQQSGFNHFLCRKKPFDASSDLPPDTMKNARFQLPCHPSSDAEQKHRVFDVLCDPLYTYRGIVGRGSAVYSVSEVLANGGRIPDLVLKFSWPSVHRATESALLSQLLEKCPELQPHLPYLVFTSEYNSEGELKLPRFAMRSSEEWADDETLQFERRNLVALVTHKYEHLWDVKTLEEFRDVFIDLVETHHHAYIQGRVLHRDLSQNNLMIRRDDGKAKGLLNDWDLSSEVDDRGNVPTSDAKHRTGTLPFLALDLLRDKPEHHLYRHDLESFLYVLLWAGLHYRLNGKQVSSIHKAVAGWNSSFEDAINSKLALLQTSWKIRELLDAFTPEFLPLKDTWAKPLLKLFKAAYRDKDDNEDDESWDKETMGGYLTFENFMKALESKPRSWD